MYHEGKVCDSTDWSNTQVSKSFQDIVPADFFVFRTPLLPMSEFLTWGEGLSAYKLWEAQVGREALIRAWYTDVQLLRERLVAVVDRPEVSHALSVASPSLDLGIEHWKCDPDSKRGIQAERALVRYFARMSGRSTPFGLFSGCSVGKVLFRNDESRTTLSLRSQRHYRPVTRLDFDYLFALTTSFQRSATMRTQLRYWPNCSLYRIADAWHYVESRFLGSVRSHHIAKVDADNFLDAVLDRAKTGAKVPDLIETVRSSAADSEISTDEAREYIQELINNEVLVSNLVPLVTGDPLDDIIAQLASLPGSEEAVEILNSVKDVLAARDHEGLWSTFDGYRSITSKLETLPAKFEIGRLCQVDMTKPVHSAVLTKTVIDALISGIEVLFRVGKSLEPEPLRSFRAAFSARYELARVPLLEALDEEVGVGFGRSAEVTSPLLRGIGFGGSVPEKVNAETHPVLLQKLISCIREGKTEVLLDLSDLPAGSSSAETLPYSFAVNATLVAESEEAVQRNEFELLVRGGVGPNGARFFGRFCHADPELRRQVRDYLREEEALDPDAVYAEIVHLPEGRIGNVLCRPVLREYELVYLGRSGAPENQQIPASDLLVAVEGGQVVLYSQRLGRRVIPRLTNAHGFMNPKLSSVYRFLCCLQHQNGVSVPAFSWGPLESLSFLPRVRVGPVILSTARWRLTREEIHAVAMPDRIEGFLALQKLRSVRGLPRWILLEEADNALPVDLDNPLCVDACIHLLKRSSLGIFREMYPTSNQLCVSGPEGRFHHELNVPFIRRQGQYKSRERTVFLATESVSRNVRSLAPGSEWLYLKLYGGVTTLDEVLTKSLPSIFDWLSPGGPVTRWYFLRYSDPERHLRIRFNLDACRLWRELLPRVSHVVNGLLASGKIWKVQFDTYEREIERYGGLEGMQAAEEIFFADSAATVEILQQLEGDEGLEYRWQIALLGIDSLLVDFGLDLNERRELLKGLKPAEEVRRLLGVRFRATRKNLEAVLDPSSTIATRFEFARKTFERRTERIADVVERLHVLQKLGNFECKLFPI